MSKNFQSNYTILVSSCDAYEDLWYPFFSLLKSKWKGVETHSIVLNTEAKKYSFDGLNILTYQLFKNKKKVKWGERLIKTLDMIDTKYVLFLLDDFFLSDEVREEEIDNCIMRMEDDESIAVFYFAGGNGQNEIESDIPDYNIKKQDGKWRLNTQAAIWRRDLLKSYIKPHESAWDWEIYGSQRSVRYAEKFYIRKPSAKKVFSYDVDWGGAIHRGKWTPYAIELCKSMNINIDFSIRGLETMEPPYDRRPEIEGLTMFQRIFRKPLGKRIIKYAKVIIYDKTKEIVVRYKSLK